VRKYIKVHDGLLLANHGALHRGRDLLGAYYKMETVEHFAHISLVARLLGRERLLSRTRSRGLQGLRGRYGIASPAEICIDEGWNGGRGGRGGVPGGAGAARAGSAPGGRVVRAGRRAAQDRVSPRARFG